jgi:hypothetical protein
MYIKTEILVRTEDVIHVVYEYYSVKILKYVIIGYNVKAVTIVEISDLLQNIS